METKYIYIEMGLDHLYNAAMVYISKISPRKDCLICCFLQHHGEMSPPFLWTAASYRDQLGGNNRALICCLQRTVCCEQYAKCCMYCSEYEPPKSGQAENIE